MSKREGPVLTPSVWIVHNGVNPYGFGLFDTAPAHDRTAPLSRLAFDGFEHFRLGC